MVDESDNLAFRRLAASVAEKLSDEEVRKIVYIHLYSQRETLFPDAKKLEVFVALEYAEVFSPSNPEGLLNILERDLKNRQLAHLVKAFIRGKKHRSVKLSHRTTKSEVSPPEMETETHLRMCYKVALAQANVLMKHLEALRQAVVGGKVEREGAQEAVDSISKAAAALAKLWEKANEKFDNDVSRSTNSYSSTTGEMAQEFQDDYDDIELRGPAFGDTIPTTTVLVKSTATGPAMKQKLSSTPTQKPPLKPKPKLDDNQQQHYTVTTGSRNASNVVTPSVVSSFDSSSKCWSLPHLDSSKVNDGTGGDEDEDDYIDPTAFQHDDDSEISSAVSQHNRPLPDPPTQHDKRVTDGDRYTPIDPPVSNKDSEPMYEEISVHTLLSRMSQPMPDSSSSSD